MTEQLVSLPTVPNELRKMSPYMERAKELIAQDKVMSYWCAYYAAQIGIGVKSSAKDARSYLFTLMGVLENMKDANRDHDTTKDDAVAAAYIENFGLQVFRAADNEDRDGRSSRSTAKRFLAAANFLECIRIFDNTLKPDVEDKIRYAKWKAADIAKAFREGRKPAAGPAVVEGDVANDFATPYSVASTLPVSDSVLSTASEISPGLKPTISPRSRPPELPLTPPRSTTSLSSQNRTPTQRNGRTHSRSPSGGHGSATNSTRTPIGSSKASNIDSRLDSMSPGTWSNHATPGVDDRDAYLSRQDTTPVRPKRATVSGEMEGKTTDDESDDGWSTAGTAPFSRHGSLNFEALRANAPPPLPPPSVPSAPPAGDGSPPQADSAPKRVRWTPSVVGGMSSTAGSPPQTPSPDEKHTRASSFPFRSSLSTVSEQDPAHHPLPTSPSNSSLSDSAARNSPPFTHPAASARPTLPTIPSAPPGTPFVPSPPELPSAPSSRVGPSVPPLPPSAGSTSSTRRASPPRGRAPANGTSAPPPPPPSSSHRVSPPPASVPAAPKPRPDLSAVTIAQAQKHCKFAISALDYEDRDHAIKELRDALRLLGG